MSFFLIKSGQDYAKDPHTDGLQLLLGKLNGIPGSIAGAHYQDGPVCDPSKDGSIRHIDGTADPNEVFDVIVDMLGA